MSGSEEPRKVALWATGLLLGWKAFTQLAGAIFSKPPASSRAGAGSFPEVSPESRPRKEDVEDEPGGVPHSGWRTLLPTCVLLIAFAAGVGFLVAYWSDASTQWLGITLAICLGGFGIVAVMWAHLLMEHKEATEELEALPSDQEEREAIQESFSGGARDIQRRRLLQWACAGGVALFGAMGISLLRSLIGQTDPALTSIVWKRGQRLVASDGSPVSIRTLRAGDSTIVFPEGSVGDQRAQTVLIRVEEKFLRLPKERANWAPMGYLAYSRVCTHAGCTVGLWEPTTHLLLCPCHQSTFDVLRAATPTGGPAARPLPQLPLYVGSDGNLRAGGRFSQLPGPGFWGMR